MRNLISILLFTLVTLTNIHASNQTFKFRDVGEVSFSQLEREISPGLDYASIDILNIRHSYNPIAYLSSLTSDYNHYVLTMVVNKRNNVTCELVEITDERSLMVKQCEGAREEVIHVGFLYYDSLKK